MVSYEAINNPRCESYLAKSIVDDIKDDQTQETITDDESIEIPDAIDNCL